MLATLRKKRSWNKCVLCHHSATRQSSLNSTIFYKSTSTTDAPVHQINWSHNPNFMFQLLLLDLSSSPTSSFPIHCDLETCAFNFTNTRKQAPTSSKWSDIFSSCSLALCNAGMNDSKFPLIGSPLKSMPITISGYFLDHSIAIWTFSKPSTGLSFRSMEIKSLTRIGRPAALQSLRRQFDDSHVI